MSDNIFRLDDRAAIVTGAASGIGRRIAIGLAEAGADVGLLDLPGSDLDGAAAEVEATGRRAVPIAASVPLPARQCVFTLSSNQRGKPVWHFTNVRRPRSGRQHTAASRPLSSRDDDTSTRSRVMATARW